MSRTKHGSGEPADVGVLDPHLFREFGPAAAKRVLQAVECWPCCDHRNERESRLR